jgi:regulator of sigma E protease
LSFGPIQILWFVVAIGVLVAVHEYGHFWVARRLGFKVLRFSVGFGRPIARRVGADGVEYVLGMFPLGGYVRLADEREAPVADEDLGRAFNRRPVWARILVLVAGAGANFLFAIAAFWCVYLVGIPGLRPMVGDVRPGSYAADAGLRAGDEIVAIGGAPVATMDSAIMAALYGVVGSGRIELQVRRGGVLAPAVIDVPPGHRRELTEPGALTDGLGFGFVQPHLPVVVGRTIDGGPAAVAGLRPGDEIVAIDGEKVAEFADLRDRIGRLGGTTVELTVRRGTADLRLPVGVRAEPDPAGAAKPPVGRIGIVPAGPAVYPPSMQVVERYGPLAAIGPAAQRTWQTTAVTLKFLWRMLTGGASLRNLNGPISLAAYAGLSAREGVGAFLMFLAAVSISLGVINLMPVPVLDGGQIVYQLAEAVRGGPLPVRVQALGQQVGIVLLLLLMSLAFYNDLRHFLG